MVLTIIVTSIWKYGQDYILGLRVFIDTYQYLSGFVMYEFHLYIGKYIRFFKRVRFLSKKLNG